jgi:hypothetical protein
MKSSLMLVLAISFTICKNPLQAQDSTTKNKLIGSWIYSGFEKNDQLPISKSEAEKAEKMNKGLIITFGSDGHYKIWKKVNGKKEILALGETRLTNQGKHLSIEGLEGDIQTLNTNYLKLFYAEDRPIMIFKKYAE